MSVCGGSVVSGCMPRGARGTLFVGGSAAMRVELVRQAADVLMDVPGDVQGEIVVLLNAAASAPFPKPGALAAAFGPSCWVEYVVRGDVVEVLDVGCLR
jgi:hypothetical protein